MTRVAIIGMACRYPDAASPEELWENVVAGRRAFRRLPDERMRLEDYWDPDPAAPDRFYARTAAVIEGYEFDRVGYKIAGSTYRSTDLTHWLALDTAARALADAGYPSGERLPRERTGVIVGNTLTGEFARANLMRLRWPYVRRTLAAALGDLDWDEDRTAGFLADLEQRYKSPFPPIDEDTLAGGLSNTIAGRICNYFDLKGGGYTVDGACSSSLLSVATACRALREGELDVAVAGGVDLSIDPFEIVGFAKTGALAKREMRVYDRGSNGFWPGEGCGMVVLMREADAVDRGHHVYASVAGWGISSDGKGGITRPEVDGYRLALGRAYERAGFGIDTVALFEGHGTGTEVGDATELTALSQARAGAGSAESPAAIGTIKGMIGHTKAAAGVAGLIKAALAVHHQVLPPTTGCFDPHPVLSEEAAGLRVLRKAEPWPEDAAFRAGVTAMGFGGINTHIVLEGGAPRKAHGPAYEALAASVQDVELLLVDAESPQALRERLAELAGWVPALSYAQLADLAAEAQRGLRDLPYRAAVIVSSPQDAETRLRSLLESLDAGETTMTTVSGGRAFMGHVTRPARLGFLFPGQGSGSGTSGGALRRRFAEVDEVYAAAALPSAGDMVATAVAQPRIVTGSMAGLRAMETLGLRASVAVGHSLGEISALHWAGGLDARTLLRVAGVRGQTMTEYSASGTMAGVSAGPEVVSGLITGLPVVIAGYNGPDQTVIAGAVEAVAAAGARAEAAGVSWTRLRVSHAFHSPLVAPAADTFAGRLSEERFGSIDRRVVSTVLGEALAPDTDIPELLRRQITEPVLFAQALALAAKDVDLFVEVGPGQVLSGLVQGSVDVPAVALDTDDESLSGLLRIAGAAYVMGAPVRHEVLFRGRFTRPIEIGAEFSFFASPCERAPQNAIGAAATFMTEPDAEPGDATGESSMELLRRLAAERAELPLETVGEDSRLLDDLHLSSITVGQLVNQAAQRLGLTVAQSLPNVATATIGELASTLDTLAETGGDAAVAPVIEGAATWARPFALDLDELPRPARVDAEDDGSWQLFDAGSELAGPLRAALQRAHVGAGVLVCLPPECEEEHLATALEAAKAATAQPPDGRFVLVQHGRGASGLVKTLRQEAPHLRVTLVQVPVAAEAVGWIVDEVAATTGFTEAHYDTAGVRRVPTLRAMPVEPARREQPLDGSDVLLVTGGGKGITAECALAVATDSGARLALLGRSDPETDEELAANLARMAGQGATVRYFRADVTRADQVDRAVAEITEELGPVTAVLHGAGFNEPAALTGLDAAAFRRTLAPKIDGLRAVLAAIEPDRLRLLVTFGSIIGRAGLRGEGHYATANDWLAELTREVAGRHPGCRSLCMEWSVWSGVGMGERLSVVEGLSRDGITAIHPDQGVQIMRRLVADPDAPTVIVISGRTGSIDTVRHDLPALPLLRFVGRSLIRYHGVELVTEVALNAGTDPYLADHLLDGNLLFPAVFGMEAMAQVAGAATGRSAVPVIEDAEFLRPIVVPPDGETVIRVAAVVTGDDTVEVAIRSAETGFAAEHFRARLRFDGAQAPDGPPDQVSGLPVVPLDPAADLYGSVLFQGRSFHRLRRYHRAAARHVDADLSVERPAGWFAGFLPGGLVLGDPGMRDALMHGNQVCVPHATLLPIGVDRIYPAGDGVAEAGGVRYCATERSRDGDTYTYDIAVRTGDGTVVERWEGLRLQAVRKTDGSGPWVAPLLGPYIERMLGDLTGAQVAVAVEPHGEPADGDERRARTAEAAGRALGHGVTVRYRPDGRPEVDGDRAISASHGAGVTLCVAATGTLACDVETVTGRPAEDWDGLLGRRRSLADLVAAEPGEGLDLAGTRVWSAAECLTKAGLPPDAPLAMARRQDGWVIFASGELEITTFVTTLRGTPDPVVFAVLAGGRS
ncbi:type I polyketide synthase [Actinomadura sp. DC4]|uniref:type I polyketide synthase n=1 Tax=Actinomadura sp. DC4 TaxID=3055069 RepID=UPI0025AF931F|nr:type I polyketide synthase [Actinomadura sp. DC4]MDN3354735.1 type I polyketide synthase [Actinomadura sp. DC4]